jgi:hypothetical protein
MSSCSETEARSTLMYHPARMRTGRRGGARHAGARSSLAIGSDAGQLGFVLLLAACRQQILCRPCALRCRVQPERYSGSSGFA